MADQNTPSTYQSTQPYWVDSIAAPKFEPLAANLHVDVIVIGGGFVGITAAYLLKRAGKTVALLERGRYGSADTAHTTAHLTCVTDARLSRLVRDFGRDHAQAVWDAGLAAISEIDSIVRRERISCEFDWVRGFLHAPIGQTDTRKEADSLAEEASLANELGFDAELVESVPIVGGPGIVFEGQAKCHPLKYLTKLVSLIPGEGSYVFEQTEVEEVRDDPLSLHARGHSVRGEYVIVATHAPLMGKANIVRATMLQTKLYPYTSYVLGGTISKEEGAPEALFWDTADPYNYLRIDAHADHDYFVFGGEDHKTGQASDTRACFVRLEQKLRQLFPKGRVTHRWSGQVIETNDGLPYIGETAPRQFIVTGCAGNGTTFGTLGAMMARDAVLGEENPWRELFDVGRTKIKGGLWNYLRENKDYPYYLIRSRFAGPEGKSLRAVKRGEGKILEIERERVAVFRAPDGEVTLLSPICTHMGCQVAWNSAEGSWDCPCHGSRFTAFGDVLAGPAEKPLSEMHLTAPAASRK